MRRGLYNILIMCIAALLFSCGNNDDEDNCTTALPAPEWFELGFFNSLGEPLVGTVYPQEEFRVFNSNSEVFVSPVPFGDPTRLQMRFLDFDSDVNYFIELTATDTDTLNFTYDVRQGPCFLNYDLTQVIYNGQTIQLSNSNRVDLIKE